MRTKAAKQPEKILFVFRSQFLCSTVLAVTTENSMQAKKGGGLGYGEGSVL